MAKLILKEESYKLIGLMFRIHSQLGPSCKEKNYQDAIEIVFKKEVIEYEREKEVFIPFEGEKLGGFFIDFLVWRKIILEVKCKPFITHEDVRQVMRYLQATGYPLALIVNFKREKVEYKRVINSNLRKVDSSELDSSQLANISDKLVKYLGIDWGEARIGLAIADDQTRLATPLSVVSDLKQMLAIINQEEIDILVIGVPYQKLSLKFPLPEEFNQFIKQLKAKVKLPIKFIDERLTSKAAGALVKNKKIKIQNDAVAAMVILQNYLDSKR